MRKIEGVFIYIIVLCSVSMVLGLSVQAQESGTVSGVIYDAETGKGLAGTNVMLEGS